MKRVPCEGFVGPSNEQITRTLDAERTINHIIQPVAPGTGRTASALIKRPCLRPWATFPDSPIVGMFTLGGGAGRAFVVGGESFAEVFSDATFGPVSSVASNGRPATLSSNGSAGNQVMVTAGDNGYIYDLIADTLTQITDPDFLEPTRVCEFADGYFFNYEGGGSRAFQFSELEDGTDWPTINIAERSIAADPINGMVRSHRDMWFLGTQTSEVWNNTGDASNPWQPIPGVLIEQGCVATYTAKRVDNTIMWLGQSEDGDGIVWRADGYTPRRVSTPTVEQAVQDADTPSDAIAWVCQLNGHYYYVLILPRIPTSWAYDLSMDRWFEWAHWNSTDCVWEPFRGSCHMFAFDKHLIGDRLSGTIYEFTASAYRDRLAAPVEP